MKWPAAPVTKQVKNPEGLQDLKSLEDLECPVVVVVVGDLEDLGCPAVMMKHREGLRSPAVQMEVRENLGCHVILVKVLESNVVNVEDLKGLKDLEDLKVREDLAGPVCHVALVENPENPEDLGCAVARVKGPDPAVLPLPEVYSKDVTKERFSPPP